MTTVYRSFFRFKYSTRIEDARRRAGVATETRTKASNTGEKSRGCVFFFSLFFSFSSWRARDRLCAFHRAAKIVDDRGPPLLAPSMAICVDPVSKRVRERETERREGGGRERRSPYHRFAASFASNDGPRRNAMGGWRKDESEGGREPRSIHD